VRREVIQRLICEFELQFAPIEQEFGIVFRDYFADVWPDLQQMARDGLISLSDSSIDIKPAGRLLARSVCMLFDRYLSEQSRQRFSRVI